MKNKKIVSMIVMFSIFINIISGLHIDAQAENTENSETYLWDFSKYTDKITTTKTGFTEKYDGLTIAIADNGDDSISTGGVYWRGGGEAKDGDSPRYIAYTPTEDGTLYATGKLNASGGRWGIHTARDYNFSTDNSTTSTSTQTVSMSCKAGRTYYIYSRTRSATVSYVRYEVNEPEEMKKWNFDFGIGETAENGIRVNTDCEYSVEKGYGFLGISENSAAYTKVVDGYYQDKDSLTTLTEGNEYVKSTDKQRPVRFAVKVNPNITRLR